MVTQLWHSDIRLPVGFKLPTHRVSLAWSRHALSARADDRYGTIPQFETISLAAFQVIEVETDNKRVTKVVIRGHYTDTLDVIFVLIPNGSRPWTIKTVWMNERNDLHRTLDRTRYVN